MPLFRDYFSDHAAEYAAIRPHYPDELFQYLARRCAHRVLAWDCATGNGQAATRLAPYFEQIYATDASRPQLDQAISKSNITYRRETAYNCSLKDCSVDLITVAQAIHWFDLNPFYGEAKRVLKSGGLIAIWTYGRIYFQADTINRVLDYFYNELVKAYWSFDRSLIESGYSKLPFPFKSKDSTGFTITHHWNFEDVVRYLYTWSSVRNYMEKEQEDPVAQIYSDLLSAWKDKKEHKTAHWPLFVRTGVKQ